MCWTSYEERRFEERREEERKREEEIARLEADLKNEAPEPQLVEEREREVARS